MLRRSFVVGCLLFSIGAPVCAQVVLTGRVTDDNDAPLADARVRVYPAGANLADAQEAHSDPAGGFSIQLPGAGDYQIAVEHDGFYELRGRAIHADSGETRVDLALNPVREVFQSSTVVGTPSPVDLAATTRTGSLTGTEIVDIPYPASHSLRNSMRIMPGVVEDQQGGVHFDGGFENQTLYTLNGFDLNDPVNGNFRTLLSVEGVRSLEFSDGRLSPEFGKGSAGVLAIHTETGTDELRYSVTNFIPGVGTQGGLHLSDWTPRFIVAGPIRKGRAWFADSFDAEYSQSVVPGLPKKDDANRRWGWGGGNLLHAQVNLSPSNILYGDFLADTERQDHFGLAPLDPVATTTAMRFTQWFESIRDLHYFGGGLLLETGYAENRIFDRTIPEGTHTYQITPYGHGGNYFRDSREQSRRGEFIANLYLRPFQFAGTHQLKIGADAARLDYHADMERTGYDFRGLTDARLAVTTFHGSGQFTRPSLESASYINDSWRVRKDLQFDIGLRQDWDELIRRVALSPRLAVSYALFGREDTRLVAGYAITRDATYLGIFSRPLDQYSTTKFPGNPGTPSQVTLFTSNATPLSSPYFTNWTASLDHRFSSRVYASVNYLRKRGYDGLTYLEEGAARMRVFELANARRDQYDSVQAGLRWLFAGQYQFSASYVRSRASSNAVLDPSIDQILRFSSDSGRLPWDTPNRFLGSGYLPLPWKNWALAFLFDARDGFPFSIQDPAGNVVGAVSSLRLPSTVDLNLSVERTLALWNYRFALRLGADNLTAHRNVTAVNNVVGSTQFLQYFGNEGRHFVLRIRFFGRERH